MSLKDFRALDNLGKGSFASVYKVLRKSDNKVYALKKVKINKMSKKEISDALNEIRFLASIRHKNIVGFLEAFLENNETELCIVMEYCGCGDLAQKVERYKRRRQYIDEDVIWRYLIQCLKALEYIHGKGICHRDIKTANCFIAEDGSVKLGDMNVSKKLNKGQLQTQIGTPYYMSPEIWNNRPYDVTCDIWSLGCMIYELASLRPPFTGTDFPSLKRSVTAGRYAPLPKKYSEALSRVIAQMLRLNHRERPAAEKLLKSPDVIARLHLDDGASKGVVFNVESQRQALLQTIVVPHNLRHLSLPKPAYPSLDKPNPPIIPTASVAAAPSVVPTVEKPISDENSVSSAVQAVVKAMKSEEKEKLVTEAPRRALSMIPENVSPRGAAPGVDCEKGGVASVAVPPAAGKINPYQSDNVQMVSARPGRLHYQSRANPISGFAYPPVGVPKPPSSRMI